MVYGDRNYNQDPVANLNSTSPLNFTDSLSAEDLARDLDLFTNTQFFDFDFGNTSTANTTGTQFTSTEQGNKPSEESSVPHISIANEPDLGNHFNFLSEPLSLELNVPATPEDGDESPTSANKRRKVEPGLGEAIPSALGATLLPEDAAKLAAEEDKRRRNTLASARFRAKKKLREQALEKDHKEMSAKIEKMENRIKELELENKWLRGLVVQNKPS